MAVRLAKLQHAAHKDMRGQVVVLEPHSEARCAGHTHSQTAALRRKCHFTHFEQWCHNTCTKAKYGILISSVLSTCCVPPGVLVCVRVYRGCRNAQTLGPADSCGNPSAACPGTRTHTYLVRRTTAEPCRRQQPSLPRDGCWWRGLACHGTCEHAMTLAQRWSGCRRAKAMCIAIVVSCTLALHVRLPVCCVAQHTASSRCEAHHPGRSRPSPCPCYRHVESPPCRPPGCGPDA